MRRPSTSQSRASEVGSPTATFPPQPSFAPAAAAARADPSLADPRAVVAESKEEIDAILMPPPPPPVPVAAPPARDHGHEELKIKLRVLEAKRAEESERLRAVEAKLRDAEELARGGVVLQSQSSLSLSAR